MVTVGLDRHIFTNVDERLSVRDVDLMDESFVFIENLNLQSTGRKLRG